MNAPLSYSVLHNHVLTKIFKKTIVTNYHPHCPNKTGHALIYYKTNGFTPGFIHNFEHTNTWEVVNMANTLNRLGFWVDIIDRSVSEDYLPTNKYDLFISDGAVDSTKYYTKYATHLTKAIKIYFAVNPNPQVRNARLKNRYREFTKRQHTTLPIRRGTTLIDINKQMAVTDYIFSVGNNLTNSTFDSFNKPLKKIFLSTYPHLRLDISSLKDKKRNNFLFFGGSGNIFKGLDLAIEAFAKLPNLNLHVCAPLEDDFLNHYKGLLSSSPNIHIHGFTLVGSPKFMQLTNSCGFVTLLGCAEGTATSVLTCMRRGLVPIVTLETGLDLGSFGITTHNLSIQALQSEYTRASNMNHIEFIRRVIDSYLESFKYTQQAFEQSFTGAILEVLTDAKKI
jgi:glycosyltransferase involved in cell wall biosynthesis